MSEGLEIIARQDGTVEIAANVQGEANIEAKVEQPAEIAVEILEAGPMGPRGFQGDTGATGADGADGVSPEVTIAPITGGHSVTITDADHPGGQTFNVMDGTDGQNGADGAAAGFGTPTASVDANVGTPAVTVTASGPDTAKVFDFAFSNLKGDKGDTGSTGSTGPAGPGVPSGGTTGQVLVKKSGTNYDTEWSELDASDVGALADDTKYALSASVGGSAKVSEGIPSGAVDNTSTSTAFTATVPGITALTDNTVMLLRNGVVTSASGFTIDVNGLGAKPVYSNMATGNAITPTDPTRETTIFNINYTMLFCYSTTLVAGGAWICYRGYDANTNTIGYQLRTNSMSLPVSGALYRYRLLFTSANGRNYVPANSTNSSSADTQKTTTTTYIDPFGEIRYYSGTATVASGSRPSTSAIWQQYTLNIGYSFNTTGAAPAMTAWRPVYLKCSPQTNGSAKISSTPYTQTLPSAADAHIYIYLGIAYNATNIELSMTHPIYYHDGTGLQRWNGVKIPRKTSDLTNDSGFISPAGTPTTGQVLMYNNGTWTAMFQEKSLQLPYQLIPLSFDGTNVSTTLTPQDISEGYTLDGVDYPPYLRSSLTKADLLGSTVLLTPVYGNTDGYEFQSGIFDLTPFGFTGLNGLLRIETSGGYVSPYQCTLVTWPASYPTPADIGAIEAPPNPYNGDILFYNNGTWIAEDLAIALDGTDPAFVFVTNIETAPHISTSFSNIYALLAGNRKVYFAIPEGDGFTVSVLSDVSPSNEQFTLVTVSRYSHIFITFRPDANDELDGSLTVYNLDPSGKIDAPVSPSVGDFLVWNGSAWVAMGLAVWQGGSY